MGSKFLRMVIFVAAVAAVMAVLNNIRWTRMIVTPGTPLI